MGSKFQKILLVLALSLLPTILVWLPFYARFESVWNIPLRQDGMATIVANFDGPQYIVAAKSLYKPEIIKTFAFTEPTIYYTAHFPLYPVVVKAIALTGLNYPYSLLAATLIGSIVAVYYFSKYISDYVDKKHILWLTFVFSIFPARWLIVRSVGSPEPFFVGFVIASIYYFKHKKYWLAGLFGVLAQLTKSPGILLFAAYIPAILFPSFKKAALTSLTQFFKHLDLKKILPLALIPLSLVGLFYFYSIQTGDFWAYFHSGDNIHLFFPPFQIFNYSQSWVGTFWLEEIIFVYLLGALGFMQLVKEKDEPAVYFVGIFFLTLLFVSHRDVIRYSLPIVPFIIAGYSKVLVQKEFKLAMLLLLIPIYLFSLVYISQNVMQISNWGPLL